MSTYEVKVIRIGELEKHPNADALEITKVWGYPVVCGMGQFKTGDLAAYVPVDSSVDTTRPEFIFLQGRVQSQSRIKAKKLRGIYSEGLLIPAKPGWVEGQDVAAELECKKWEPPETFRSDGENESEPSWFGHYTDIENLKRYPHILKEGELVVISEKLHGANGRLAFHEGKFWVGSHTQCKRMGTPFPTIWEKTLEKVPGLKELVQDLEGHIIHGEVFGPVQVLKYGAQKNDLFFRIFDIQEIASRRYLDWMDVTLLHPRLPAFWVPLLHKGPWSPDLVSWAEGRSSIAGANHIREGVVIKPMKERWDQEVGRVVLKVISEAYRLKDYDQGGH